MSHLTIIVSESPSERLYAQNILIDLWFSEDLTEDFEFNPRLYSTILEKFTADIRDGSCWKVFLSE